MSDHVIVMITGTADIQPKFTDPSLRKILYHKPNWNAIKENPVALAADHLLKTAMLNIFALHLKI